MFGRSIVIALFVVFILVQGKKKTEKSSKDSDTDKSAAKIATLASKFEGQPLVPLFDSNFSKFVIDRPRDYSAFLMLTATGSKYQCSICVRSKEVFEEAARYYYDQYDFNSTAAEKRIAFFNLEVDDARTVFGDLQLETVPHVYLLPPTKAGGPKLKISDFEIEARLLLEGPGSVLREIEEKTGVHIDVTINPEPLLLAISAVSVLVALFVSAASYDVFGAFLWYQTPKLWSLVSLLCFSVGVSGCLFCIIRSAPLYGHSRNGISIFAPAGRDQYLIEGIIVALWTLGAGAAMYIMYLSSKVKFYILRHVLIMLSMSIFIILLLQIWEAYTDKTRWYNIRETFPAEVWSWITASVKKNSGLGKRLWRISEYWLFETKDWSGFEKKFKALIVDYVQRIITNKEPTK